MNIFKMVDKELKLNKTNTSDTEAPLSGFKFINI